MEMENFPSETSDLQIENSTSSLVSEVNEDPIETTIDPIEEFSTYIENDGDKEVNNSSSIEPGMEDPEELSKLESELYKKLDNLDKMMNYNYPTLDIKKQALLSINNESKSSLKYFINRWSKLINNNYNKYTKKHIVNSIHDFSIDEKLRNAQVMRVDKKKFTSTILDNISNYKDMNTRIVFYEEVLSLVDDLERIISEPVTYKFDLGPTLEKVIKFSKTTKFGIEKLTSLSDYKKFVDIRPGFKFENNKSLGELSYTPMDCIRFGTKMKKNKDHIYQASSKLLENLQSRPDRYSRSTCKTIHGLLAYASKDNDKHVTSNESDITRLYRLATIVTLFNAICNYAYRKDYDTCLDLLDTVISSKY